MKILKITLVDDHVALVTARWKDVSSYRVKEIFHCRFGLHFVAVDRNDTLETPEILDFPSSPFSASSFSFSSKHFVQDCTPKLHGGLTYTWR